MAVAEVGSADFGSSVASPTLTRVFNPDAAATMLTVSVVAKAANLTDRTIVSVTYAGSGSPVALTKVGEFDNGSVNISHWYLPNPNTTSGDIVVTNESGSNAAYIWRVARGFNGTSGSGSFVGGTNSASAGSGDHTTTV